MLEEIIVYEKLSAIKIAPLRTKFPYNLQFTKKQIELHTSNGQIYLPQQAPKKRGGEVIIYGWQTPTRHTHRHSPPSPEDEIFEELAHISEP